MFYIQIIFIFVITVLISTLMGDAILGYCKIEKRWKRIAIGFFSFLAIYQLLITPGQIFHFGTIFLVITLIAEIIFVIFISFWKIKNIILDAYKEIILVIIFGTLSMALFYICERTLDLNYTFADVFYYLRFIQVNSDVSSLINGIDPTSGIIGSVSPIYALSGAHHLFSAMSILSGVSPVLLTMWYGTLLMHGLAFSVFSAIAGFFKNKLRITIVIFLFCISAFLDKGIIFGFLPIYLRGLTGATIFPLLFIVLYYKKSRNKGYLYLYLLTSIGLMSCRSSEFFINVITIFGVCVYEMIVEKNYNIHHYTIISIPSIIYSVAWCIYSESVVIAFVIFAFFVIINLLYLIDNFKEYWKYILLIGLALLFMLINASFLFINNSFWDIGTGFAFFRNYFAISIESVSDIISLRQCMYIIFIVILLAKYKSLDSTMKFIVVFSVSVVLFFFNPFASTFISKFLTGEAYDRVSGIFMNQTFILLILYYMLNHYRFLFNMFVSLEIIAVLMGVSGEVKSTIKRLGNIETHENTVLRYKVSKNVYEVGTFLRSLDDKLKAIYPYTINNVLLMCENIYQSNGMVSWKSLRSINMDWSNIHNNDYLYRIQAAITEPHYYYTDYLYQFESDNMLGFKELILSTNTDLFIMSKWKSDESNAMLNSEINEFAYLIYSNGSFNVYRVYID